MIYILARNYQEAVLLARRYELYSREWTYLSDERRLRGTRGAHVIATRCWSFPGSPRDDFDISMALRWADAKVAMVECP